MQEILSVLLATIICLSSFSIGFVAFAAVIFANHYLISKGEGFIAIPENDVPEFKQLLVAYYEDRDNGEITEFLKKKCWRIF